MPTPKKPASSRTRTTASPPARKPSWPVKGGTGKEPWQDPELGVTPRAGLPLLSSGSAHPIVLAACRTLAALDEETYTTPASRGENAYGVLGAEELGAIRRFRADYGISEDPTAFGGDNPVARELADNHVGAFTFEAICRLAERHGDPIEVRTA